MNLLEHESKALLAASGVPVPVAALIHRSKTLAALMANLSTPLVLKSQVATGGRGKAGGIKVVEAAADLQATIDQLIALPIKGLLPSTLLAEEKLAITRELYLSLLVDRSLGAVKLMAHSNGGVEVEDNHDFKEWPVDGKSAEELGQALADYYGLPQQTFALQDLVENLLTCLYTNDALMIEINPLALTAGDTLVAADAKIILDDAATFRHDWQFEQAPAEANFVTINQQGNTATIANGAGLAMATVDAAVDAGLEPANFLDIGGGASADQLFSVFQRIMEYPSIQVIIINIFAGITRSDEVAKAIIAARDKIDGLPPLFIRLAGTSDVKATELLAEANIATLPDLESCLNAAKRAIDA